MTVMSYVERNLRIVPGAGYFRKLGRCISEGSLVYERKDGEPLTTLDINELRKLRFGQSNLLTAKAGDKRATISYMCDSSD